MRLGSFTSGVTSSGGPAEREGPSCANAVTMDRPDEGPPAAVAPAPVVTGRAKQRDRDQTQHGTNACKKGEECEQRAGAQTGPILLQKEGRGDHIACTARSVLVLC